MTVSSTVLSLLYSPTGKDLAYWYIKSMGLLYRYQFIMNSQENHFCLANLQLQETFIWFLTILIPFLARWSRFLIKTLHLLCRIIGVLARDIYSAARETLTSLLSVHRDVWHEFCLWDELTDDDRNGARCDTCKNRHF